MKIKVIGYIIAIFGLGVLLVGAGDFELPLLGDLDGIVGKSILNIVALILIGLGVVLVIVNSDSSGKASSGYPGKRKSKGKVDDLPVYEGDNIVAYRRD